jgi:hypothetical protein
MSTGGASNTIPNAGAVTALRLIFFGVVTRGSLLQAGAPNSQPPTPGHMAAAGDVTKLMLIDTDYKTKKQTK